MLHVNATTSQPSHMAGKPESSKEAQTQPAKPKKLFLVTTETSGDLLGGRLLRELKTMVPALDVRGVGGDLLQAEGMHQTYDVRDFNVMGLVEVLSQLRRLKGMFNHLVAELREWRPDVIVLVDAPDFNLRFAKAVAGLGIPIIYYVSPQVWAWRKGRAKKIARLVDHMLVLFEFEKAIYAELDLPTTWVGHPLVDELKTGGSREEFFASQGLDPQRPLVALAPGSRNREVTSLLPVMARAAAQRLDRYQFAIPIAPALDRTLVADLLGQVETELDRPLTSSIRLLPGLMRPLMRHADAAIVASGTATLETGLLHTPMIVGYRLKQLSYALASRLVKVEHVALVNIVLGKRVVPELIQDDFCPEAILTHLDALIEPGETRDRVLAEFDRLEHILGGGGAARRAATVVKDYLA